MKVVLFCGGQGLRLREYSESVPKPMVPIGQRPILWNLMKYYAHFGHKDFILCLGWQAEVIKDYFLNYNECISNDFQLSQGGRRVELLNTDIGDWSITFVDTGINSNIGQRLSAVKPHLEDEEVFLANYSDGLTDMNLDELVDCHQASDAVATFLAVKPTQSFHVVDFGTAGEVQGLTPISQSPIWMNAGFFVFSQEVFDFMQPGEELVAEPFERLMAQRRLQGVRYEGFLGCMDTYKEKQQLEERYQRGDRPWEVWKTGCCSLTPNRLDSLPRLPR